MSLSLALALALAGLPPAPSPPPVVGRPVPSPPAPPPSDGRRRPAQLLPRRGPLIGPDDYPAAAIRAGMQGITAFTLDIDATGMVSGCTVTASSGSTLLDSEACRLLVLRARFRPAELDGVPVPDTFRSRVRWALPVEPIPDPSLGPPDVPPTPAVRARPAVALPVARGRRDYPALALRNREEGRVGYRLFVTEQGRVVDCSIRVSSGSARLDLETCRLLRTARFVPGRDSARRPAPDIFDGELAWSLRSRSRR